jgi:alpha-amylase
VWFASAGSTQRHWPFPSDRVSQGYAYILTHPGMPCVAFDHYFDWGSKLQGEINALLQVGAECDECS